MVTNSFIDEALLITGNIRERLQAQMEAGRRHLGFCLTGAAAPSDGAVAAIKTAHPADASDNVARLNLLYERTESCQKCPLGKTRKNLVFGEGNPNAMLMLIGEAPGADEDEQGRPFVGKAGQLLTKIIEAMRLKRSDVYICNILKCRPPGNRAPQPTESAVCLPTLLEQIGIIKPRIICALGAVPTQTLLNENAPISVLRGRFYDYDGIKIMPTFHPAYLLRNPQAKKSVWEDVQLIMKDLDL